MRYFVYLRKSTDDDEHQVLSLESQEREIRSRFGDAPGIELLSLISESRSAKYPGRPLFNEMLDRIARGDADGIVAWQPDRLARNPLDSGRIVDMLDTGKLKDLKFCAYSFENTASGKYMLQIMLATAKYHVDHMSDNIRTGNRTKVLNGWRPNLAPIGYLNDKETSTIIADPERFSLVKRLWEHLLTGAYTIRELRDLAGNEWGLRRKQRKKTGGTMLTISGLYWLFQNPFYAGILRHEGRDYLGKHPRMVNLDQFEVVQRALGRNNTRRVVRHVWTYTGLMKCICGHAVTGEKKTNRFGSTYMYYHCAHTRPGNRCPEPYVQEREIDIFFREFVRAVTLPQEFHRWALEIVHRDLSDATNALRDQRDALERSVALTATELRNLRHMRLREQITEAEYIEDRHELERKLLQGKDELERLTPEAVIEPQRAFILFNVRALAWFDEGDAATKRMIVETASSNPVLHAKKLKIDARFPFTPHEDADAFRLMCTALDVIGTFPDKSVFEKLIRTVQILASEDDDKLVETA